MAELHNYTLDAKVLASFTVRAENPKAARAFLREALDAHEIDLGVHNERGVTAAATRDGGFNLTEIDGKDPDDVEVRPHHADCSFNDGFFCHCDDLGFVAAPTQ